MACLKLIRGGRQEVLETIVSLKLDHPFWGFVECGSGSSIGRGGGKSDLQRSMKGFIMAGLSFKKLLEGDIEIWTEPRKLIVRQMVRSFFNQ